MTIRQNLLGAFLLLSLVPVVLLALVAFTTSRTLLRAEIEASVRARAESVSAQIDRMLFERLQNGVTWSHLQVMQDARIGDVDKRLSQFLQEVRQRYGGVYRALHVLDPGGRVVASSEAGRIGQPLAAGARWLQAQLVGGAVTIDRLERSGGAPRLRIRTPIASAFEAGTVGELVLEFDWSQVERLLDDAGGAGRAIVVVDAAGDVVAASQSLRSSAPPGLRDWLPAASGTSVIERAGAPLLPGPVLVGLDRSRGYEHFAGFGWTTMIVQPVDVALRPVRIMAAGFAVIAVLIAIACAVAAQLLARRIARPIAALTAYTREFMAAGALPAPPPPSAGEVGALRDTFVRTVEALEESRGKLVRASKLAALGELSAVLAHEIRTPLGIVRSSAQVLASEPLSAEGRELLGFIYAETARLNRLVSALLDSTRARPLVLADEQVHPLLARCCDMVAAQARERGVAVEHALQATRDRLRCDAEQLSQAILNLLLNAIQILPAGGHVRVLTRDDGAALLIEVADDGPGIPAAERERIFDPFVFKREGGTGLGLAIVKQVIEAHGGRVEVGDAAGGGALFRLSLPRG